MHKIIPIALCVFFTNIFFSSILFAFDSADFNDDESVSSHENYSDDDDSYHRDAFESQQYAENTRVVSQPFYYADNQSTKSTNKKKHYRKKSTYTSYSSRLPQTLGGYNEKVIIVNPRKHVWGAYSADGKLLRAGLATAGSSWCPDIHRACRTRSGSFRIFSLGSRSCYSKRYPVGRGGAPMPYCMFFNGNQGLHGSHEIAEANLSHGCVRISVSDAEWVRFNFANIGTKIIVTSY